MSSNLVRKILKENEEFLGKEFCREVLKLGSRNNLLDEFIKEKGLNISPADLLPLIIKELNKYL